MRFNIEGVSLFFFSKQKSTRMVYYLVLMCYSNPISKFCLAKFF